MRIRTKALIIFLLLSLGPLALIGVIAYKNGEEAIKKSLGSSFQHTAYETTDKIDRSLYEVYHNVQTWSELELMQEVIIGDADFKISLFLIGLSKEYGYFFNISVLNNEGESIASSDSEWIGRNFREESFYINAINGHAYVEDIRINEMSQTGAVTFSFPIRSKFEEGKIIGVLCARWNAKELFSITHLHKTKDEGPMYGHLVLIRKDGLIILAPEFKKESIFKRNLIQAGLKSALLASQQNEGYLVETDEDNKRFLIGYSYSQGYRTFSGLGWAALVFQDIETAFAPVKQLRTIMLGVGAIVALTVTLLSLITTRKMTDPIVKISQVASQVAQGDFEGKVDDTFSRDEISFLSKTFNQMIQDLKKQRAQLVDKDYVDSIIASMIDTLVVIDPDGIIKTVNKATCDLLNYREEELIGKPITTIFAEPESEALSSKTDELIRQGFIGNFEKTLLAKDGRRITVSFLGSVMRDHQGTIEGIICIARDLTERKWAEEKMRQQNEYLTALNNELEKTLEQLKATQNRLITQEKLASLGALTAGIAHELKNPLNFVNNFAKFSIELTEELREDLSSQKDRLDSEVFVNIEGTLNDLEQFTKKINDHGKRADSIIRNMLLHSRGKPGEKQLVDINALLSEYVDLVYHGMRAKDTTFNTKIEKDYDPSIGMVEVVPQNLGRVFLNIINNACYAIHKKAKEIKEEFSPTLWLRTKNLGKQVEICIYDNGDGIPKAIIDKIFNPFFTTKPAGDGTGLGLSISYDIIVHEHKGEIRVETEEGSYAKFIIVLPK